MICFLIKRVTIKPVTFFSTATSWFWAYRGFGPGNGNFDAFCSCLILGLYKQEFGCRGGSNNGQEAGQNQQEQEAPAAGDEGRHAPTTLATTQGWEAGRSVLIGAGQPINEKEKNMKSISKFRS